MSRVFRRSAVLLLVLASGAGLLVFGALGLVGALREAEQRAAEDAERIWEGAAQELRRELLDGAPGHEIEAAARYVLRSDGQGWVGSEPQRPELYEASGALRKTLQAARRLELSDPAAAIGALRDAVEGRSGSGHSSSGDADPEARALLLVRAGWMAHRAGQPVLRDELIASALDLSSDVWRSCSTDLVTGLILLVARVGQPVDSIWLRRLSELDDELADGVVAQLVGIGAEETARLAHSEIARGHRLRSLDAAANAWLLDGHADSVARTLLPAGAALVAWAPETRTITVFDGRSIAPVANAVVASLIPAEAAVSADSAWSMAAEGGEQVGAVPVVEGHLVLLPVVSPAGFGSVWLGVSVLGALAMCFLAGLIAMFRAVRAETAAARSRSEFLQSVTHELKTPLASIRLLAERLESGRVAEGRAREYHGMLADESTRLSVLIDNVLDLGRIERGERSYDRRHHDLADVVRDTLSVFAPLAHRDGIELVVDLDAADGAMADVDRGAIQQVLLNVLENARKYAKSGRKVSVRAVAVPSGDVHIDIRDYGVGIDPAERSLVFERFRRGARHHDGSIAGVGLGLHLARSILTAHGGTIECLAPEDDGAGARFRLQIPRAPLSQVQSS